MQEEGVQLLWVASAKCRWVHDHLHHMLKLRPSVENRITHVTISSSIDTSCPSLMTLNGSFFLSNSIDTISFTFLHFEISWEESVDFAPCSSWLMRKPNMEVFSYIDNNGYVCIYLIRYKKKRWVMMFSRMVIQLMSKSICNARNSIRIWFAFRRIWCTWRRSLKMPISCIPSFCTSRCSHVG